MNYSPNHPAVQHWNAHHGTHLGYAPTMKEKRGWARITAAWVVMFLTLGSVGTAGPASIIAGAGLYVWLIWPWLRREDRP